MIELKGSDTQTLFVVDPKDIVGLYTYSCDGRDYYSVIIRGIHQWHSVTAETFFTVKKLLQERLTK